MHAAEWRQHPAAVSSSCLFMCWSMYLEDWCNEARSWCVLPLASRRWGLRGKPVRDGMVMYIRTNGLPPNGAITQQKHITTFSTSQSPIYCGGCHPDKSRVWGNVPMLRASGARHIGNAELKPYTLKKNVSASKL